ncbi:MAG: MBL fold metallo-hydrolase [Bacteroidetes bacterium]|nr:MBL fold metallo-hydrolase [Bacteroidota bacterium]
MKSNLHKAASKIILIFISALLLACVTYGIVYYLYYHYNEELTVRLTGDVIVINDLISTMYLVKTDKGYIAIDTGFDKAIVTRGLEYNRIKPEEVNAILITHSDKDHQNVGDLFSKADVYFPKKENEMIEQGIPRFRFLPFIKNSNYFKKYSLVSDNDSFIIDNRKIKCISLTGHTLGSMGYIIDEKYLFIGDAFRIKDGKIALPNRKFLAMDIGQMKKSIERVAKLKGIKYIFSAHSGFTADFAFAVSN